MTVTAAGTVVVTATIANGTAQGTAYTQDFSITVSSGGNNNGGGGTGGNLTINGLADYNGKYVFALDDNHLDLFAAANVTGNETSGTVTGGLVTNGSVSLKVFNDDNTPYTGSDSNVLFNIISNSTATVSSENLIMLVMGAIMSGDYKEVTVSFNNGSATGTAVNPGSGNNNGGGTAFSSLMGTWTKSTGETLKGEESWGKNFLNFWSNGTTASQQADLSCEVTSINGSTAVLKNDYNSSYTYTVSITVTETTLTISGFSGSYQSVNLTQFNGTYTKTGGNVFVPVTVISNVPDMAIVGTPLTLTGTVSPENATNQTIAWTVKNAGTTGAIINGSTLTVTAAGTVVVTAAIANGTAQGTAFTQDFSISAFTSDTIADITSFSFSLSNGYYPINNTNKTINVIVPPGTDITALTPVIDHSGVTINPAPEGPMNFTEPVVFTVSAESGGQTSYTVTVTDTITTTALLDSYLQNNPSNNINTPVPVKVNINLASDWSSLLSVLNSRNSYVALDLSGSTGMATFNPGTSNTGKNRIVSLILPVTTTATSDASNSYSAAFQYFTSLKSITGVNVTTLGSGSFYGLSSLETANFPALTAIATYAFYNCTGLTGITIPDSVTSIGYDTFRNCTGLTVTIQTNKITTTQTNNWNNIFRNNTALSVIFGDGITNIGSYAFSECTGLTSVTIPDSVTSIGGSAFEYCSGLTSVTIGNSVTSIGNYAFPGNLRDEYIAAGGGPGTYTRSGSGTTSAPYVWTKVN